MELTKLLDKHSYNSYQCNDECEVWVISEKQMNALLSERDLIIEPKDWIKSDIMPFAHYLHELDRIRLDSQVPPFETIEMIVDGYIKAKIEPVEYIQIGGYGRGESQSVSIKDCFVFDDISDLIQAKKVEKSYSDIKGNRKNKFINKNN